MISSFFSCLFWSSQGMRFVAEYSNGLHACTLIFSLQCHAHFGWFRRAVRPAETDWCEAEYVNEISADQCAGCMHRVRAVPRGSEPVQVAAMEL